MACKVWGSALALCFLATFKTRTGIVTDGGAQLGNEGHRQVLAGEGCHRSWHEAPGRCRATLARERPAR